MTSRSHLKPVYIAIIMTAVFCLPYTLHLYRQALNLLDMGGPCETGAEIIAASIPPAVSNRIVPRTEGILERKRFSLPVEERKGSPSTHKTRPEIEKNTDRPLLAEPVCE